MELVINVRIVKRDGRTVEYNPDKIRIAIGKANAEVVEIERIDDKKIEEIIKYIESLDKKRMLVEDIQDIIEFKLMEFGAFALAKKYIIYRYKRSIIRQSNTTDASILSIMKNGNSNGGNYLIANKQRDVMAGEASMDLAYRLLLPKNVVEADKLGRIKFSNIEHFTEPIIESVKIDLSDMLEEGTVINGVKIEKPKGFQSACNVFVEIIGAMCSCQTGPVYVELSDLFKYYDYTFEKKYSMYESLMKTSLSQEQIRALAETQSFLEVKTGIQTIFYQLNTITLADGEAPKVHILIDVANISSEHEEKMVFEFVREKVAGIKNEYGEEVVTDTPSLIVSMDMESENAKRYDYILKELASSGVPFIAMSSKRYREFKKELEKFNQGSMVLNLGKLALDFSDKDTFFEMLNETLGYCYEGFLCRNHNLQGVYSDKSPIHWRHGGIARLDVNERIDSYLKKDKSFMMLSCVGFEAASTVLALSQEEKRQVRDIIEDTVKRWNKENSFEVVVSNHCSDEEIRSLFKLSSQELKKYCVTSYEDSFAFMKDNYFKSGLICYKTSDGIDVLDDAILSSNLIIVKRFSIY